MTLKNYSGEELEATSMIELANDIMYDAQQAQDFNDLFNNVAELKGFTDEQKQQYIAQFYTDLTIDGRFLTVQSGIWGLKRWYPVEQMDQFVTEEAPKKSKKKKKKQPKEPVPHEEASETETDQTDSNVEVLTGKFEDEVPDDADEFNENEGFDDEFDEADDDFDDDDDDEADDNSEASDDSDEEDDKQ